MQSKGFTLIEMVIVLLIISSLFVLTPSITSTATILHFEMNRMLDILKQVQWAAIQERKIIDVNIFKNKLIASEKVYDFDSRMTCDASPFHFNARGNVSQAQTITCYVNQKSKQLVIHLGSGNVYLR